jgi:Protein of unknown function (DUF3106)
MHFASARVIQTRLARFASLFGCACLFVCIMSFGLVAAPVHAQLAQDAKKPSANVANNVANEVKPVSQAAIPWKKVPDAEKKILSPVESEWAKMTGTQQRKLLGAAKEYPKLSSTEQARFQERLKGWSSLTPDQRKAARDKYQSLNSLPPEKQQELKSRWNERQQAGDKPAT